MYDRDTRRCRLIRILGHSDQIQTHVMADSDPRCSRFGHMLWLILTHLPHSPPLSLISAILILLPAPSLSILAFSQLSQSPVSYKTAH
ncbi:hypothetical protein E2C01_051014 [Portunus trituberculatus]|uniref:Uncharacterized protein n=1 Tax=Portunus trituberculatus TaxID=210409 RepID=A0A5B7GHY1_PORTR|nr:hypothetical protein [Portunus trituberculatus]